MPFLTAGVTFPLGEFVYSKTMDFWGDWEDIATQAEAEPGPSDTSQDKLKKTLYSQPRFLHFQQPSVSPYVFL
jgi:hypothetical protein